MKKSQEFQDRQNVDYDDDNLGELPDDITRERDEFEHYDFVEDKEGRHDVFALEKTRRAPTELGTAPYGGDSISHYDSRPINAIDWDFTSLNAWTVTGNAGDTLLTTAFSVPPGYIAVIRGWRYQMIPTVSMGINEFLVDLLVNRSAPLNYQRLMKGQAIADFIPTFLLVPTGGTIGLGFLATVALGAAAATRTVHVEFVGNLLQDSGAPLNQEISNRKLQEMVSREPGAVRRIRRPRKPRPNVPWGPLRRY